MKTRLSQIPTSCVTNYTIQQIGWVIPLMIEYMNLQKISIMSQKSSQIFIFDRYKGIQEQTHHLDAYQTQCVQLCVQITGSADILRRRTVDAPPRRSIDAPPPRRTLDALRLGLRLDYGICRNGSQTHNRRTPQTPVRRTPQTHHLDAQQTQCVYDASYFNIKKIKKLQTQHRCMVDALRLCCV